MPDHRWRPDPMGRPYDPYRGFDERGRTASNIPDESGYDMNADRRGSFDRGYQPDEHRRREQATDQYRSRDRGHLGDWDWQRARRGEVEGDYGRAYGNRETGTYHRDDQYGGRRDYRGGYVSREDVGRRMGNEHDRYEDQRGDWDQRRRDRDRGWPGM